MDITREITDILQSLGNMKNTRGRRRTVAVITMALEDEDRMTPATKKKLYEAVGKQVGCKGPAVERNIRTIAGNSWKARRARLVDIAGYDLDSRPTAAEFVDIITNYMLRKRAKHM